MGTLCLAVLGCSPLWQGIHGSRSWRALLILCHTECCCQLAFSFWCSPRKAQAQRMMTGFLRSIIQNRRVLCWYAQWPISQVILDLIDLTVNLYLTHSETWEHLMCICYLPLMYLLSLCIHWPIDSTYLATSHFSITHLSSNLMFDENGKQNNSKINTSFIAFPLW